MQERPRTHPHSVSRSHWRLILGTGGGLDPADGHTNMAVDQALLASVRDGGAPVLRFYRWDPPTLSFGRNQPARGRYDEDEARDRGIAFVRRPTGGQAVLHADELTYAVVAPVAVLGKPREAYRRVNEAVVVGLRSLGLAASVAEPLRGGTRTRGRGPDWGRACFRAPAAGEVVVGGRKVVGSAQRCEGRTILQHGSILMGGSQSAAEELLLGRGERGEDGADAAVGWSTLEDELGRRPGWIELVEALSAGFADVIGTRFAPGPLGRDEAEHLTETKRQFQAPEWTWRR